MWFTWVLSLLPQVTQAYLSRRRTALRAKRQMWFFSNARLHLLEHQAVLFPSSSCPHQRQQPGSPSQGVKSQETMIRLVFVTLLEWRAWNL